MGDWEKAVRELIGDAPEVHGVDDIADFPDEIPPHTPVLDTKYEQILAKTPDGELHYMTVESMMDGPDGQITE